LKLRRIRSAGLHTYALQLGSQQSNVIDAFTDGAQGLGHAKT
jgi:hypothetical protein